MSPLRASGSQQPSDLPGVGGGGRAHAGAWSVAGKGVFLASLAAIWSRPAAGVHLVAKLSVMLHIRKGGGALQALDPLAFSWLIL